MNWQDIAAPLIKLGLTGLGTAFGGPLGGTIGGALGSAIAGALGTDATPEAVSQALADNPDVAIAKLKDLEAQRQADSADLQAQLADVQDARHMELGLAQANSPIAWAPVVISGLVLLITGGVIAAVGMGRLPDSSLVTGAVLTWTATVIAYWLGSSNGSRRNGDAVREIARASSIPSAGQVAGAAIRAVAKKVAR